jgi:hypothetical protein
MLNYLLLALNQTVVFRLALATSNPVYLISTKGSLRVWPRSRGCLLLHGTWSYLRICRGSCCPTLDFVFTFWIMITFNTLTSLFDIFKPTECLNEYFFDIVLASSLDVALQLWQYQLYTQIQTFGVLIETVLLLTTFGYNTIMYCIQYVYLYWLFFVQKIAKTTCVCVWGGHAITYMYFTSISIKISIQKYFENVQGIHHSLYIYL